MVGIMVLDERIGRFGLEVSFGVGLGSAWVTVKH